MFFTLLRTDYSSPRICKRWLMAEAVQKRSCSINSIKQQKCIFQRCQIQTWKMQLLNIPAFYVSCFIVFHLHLTRGLCLICDFDLFFLIFIFCCQALMKTLIVFRHIVHSYFFGNFSFLNDLVIVSPPLFFFLLIVSQFLWFFCAPSIWTMITFLFVF